MRLATVALLFGVATIGPQVAMQAKPLSPPEKGVTKGKRSLSAEKPTKPRQDQNAASNEMPVGQQQSAPERKAEGSQSKEDAPIQRKLVLFTELLVVVGALQFVALLWQAIVFIRTLRAINRQTGTLSDTAIRQLQAYVCVDSAALKFPQPDVPEAQIHFRNCGQTPAYDFRGWIHTWFGEYPLNDVLPSPPSDLTKGTEVLAPGRKSIFVAPRKPPLPAQFLALLGTAQFTLYVYGEVHYRDAFGKVRCTKYRLIHGGAEGIREVPGKEEWLLKPDTEGNEAT